MNDSSRSPRGGKSTNQSASGYTDDARVAAEQWKKWVEVEIGGPPGRIQAAYEAVLQALKLKPSPSHVIQVAKHAASIWTDDMAAEAVRTRPTSRIATDGMASTGVIRGQVAGFLRRSVTVGSGTNEVLWSFSLFRPGIGENGRPFSPLVIQMQGWKVEGPPIEDGDTIEIGGPANPGTIMAPKRVLNVSKNATNIVRATKESPRYKFGVAFKAIFIICWLIFAFFLIGPHMVKF